WKDNSSFFTNNKKGLPLESEDFSRNATATNFIPHPHKLFETSILHLAFSFEMDNQRTLFSLLLCMPANFHQSIDDPIKCIYIVIEHNQTPYFRINGLLQNFGFDVFADLHYQSKFVSDKQIYSKMLN